MHKMDVINSWCAQHKGIVFSRQIIDAVKKAYYYNNADLINKSDKEHVEARRCLIWFCKKLSPKLSYIRIGSIVQKSGSTTSYHNSKTKAMIAACDEEMILPLWRVFINLKKLT